jgi:hypothetical protein
MTIETRSDIKTSNFSEVPLFAGIPNGERLGRSEYGGWALFDVDGEEVGYGSNPEGALLSRYRFSEARDIAKDFIIFNSILEGGELNE